MSTDATTNVQSEVKRLRRQISWLRSDLDPEVLGGLAQVSNALRDGSWTTVLHETHDLNMRLMDFICLAERRPRQEETLKECIDALGETLPPFCRVLEDSEQPYVIEARCQASLAIKSVSLFLMRMEWFYVAYPKGDKKRSVYMSVLKRYSKQAKWLSLAAASFVVVPIGQNIAASMIYDSARPETSPGSEPTQWTVLPTADTRQRVEADYRAAKDRLDDESLSESGVVDVRRDLLEIAARADKLGHQELADNYRAYAYLQCGDRQLRISRDMSKVEESFVKAAEITGRMCVDGGKKRDAVQFCSEVVPSLRKLATDPRCTPVARRAIRGYLTQVAIR